MPARAQIFRGDHAAAEARGVGTLHSRSHAGKQITHNLLFSAARTVESGLALSPHREEFEFEPCVCLRAHGVDSRNARRRAQGSGGLKVGFRLRIRHASLLSLRLLLFFASLLRTLEKWQSIQQFERGWGLVMFKSGYCFRSAMA